MTCLLSTYINILNVWLKDVLLEMETLTYSMEHWYQYPHIDTGISYGYLGILYESETTLASRIIWLSLISSKEFTWQHSFIYVALTALAIYEKYLKTGWKCYNVKQKRINKIKTGVMTIKALLKFGYLSENPVKYIYFGSGSSAFLLRSH